MDPAVMDALRRWSEDELRSMNGQIEFLLRKALIQSGRLDPAQPSGSRPSAQAEGDINPST
jgi:hypothetical protein